MFPPTTPSPGRVLQWLTNSSSCLTNAKVWITNVTATAMGSGSNLTMKVTFTIAGGSDGYPYDVFANSVLSFGTNAPWAWLGQGYHCNIYTVTNLPPGACFLILGTPQDSDGDGLTDAYERLASHTDPNQAQWDVNGVPYAWYLQFGQGIGSATNDPDADALLNYQEYQYGTKPLVSEGLAVWTTAGNASIP
jgi:hypothetical protein